MSSGLENVCCELWRDAEADVCWGAGNFEWIGRGCCGLEDTRLLNGTYVYILSSVRVGTLWEAHYNTLRVERLCHDHAVDSLCLCSHCVSTTGRRKFDAW